jgi:hypothetical protein
MKKLGIVALVAFSLSLTLTSCRKERTCECKTTSTEVRIGFGEQTTVENTTSKVTKEKQTKKAFKYSTGCFSESYNYNDDGGNGPSAWSSTTNVVTECELK